MKYFREANAVENVTNELSCIALRIGSEALFNTFVETRRYRNNFHSFMNEKIFYKRKEENKT